MKNLLFFAALALLFSACSSNVSDKTGKKDTGNSIAFTNDMENASAKIPLWLNEASVIEGTAHSGKFSCMLDQAQEYSYSFTAYFSNISEKLPKKLHINAWIYSTVENPDASFVVAIDSSTKNIYWNSAVLMQDVPKANVWTEVNYYFNIDKPIGKDDKVMVFIWNKNKLKFYYDDPTITFEY
jgi:hypothetical protein